MTSLSNYAWRALGSARVRSGIPVGCAVLTTAGGLYHGCNIELEFRLGMHAEVNVLSTMLSMQPAAVPMTILLAAERETFGPCGSCLDWIIQLNPEAYLLHESKPGVIESYGNVKSYMPRYPGVSE